MTRFLAWLREEWRLMRLETWANEPRPAQTVTGTMRDDRVAAMVIRQRAFGKRLRRQGKSLLSGHPYRPTLTRPQEPAAPKSAKVLTLPRRRA